MGEYVEDSLESLRRFSVHDAETISKQAEQLESLRRCIMHDAKTIQKQRKEIDELGALLLDAYDAIQFWYWADGEDKKWKCSICHALSNSGNLEDHNKECLNVRLNAALKKWSDD